jgi:hypothetical protein
MKHVTKFPRLIFLILLLTGILFSCRKAENDNPGLPPDDDSGLVNADTIANHLLFANAIKNSGSMPKGPAGSTLKISVDDTLYLADDWKLPINFLHEDTTKNLSGVYVQVRFSTIGSTFYYDVAEVKDVATNDTVSTILVGIDQDGIEDSSGVPPAGGVPFEITLVPHDPNGQPLGEITVPVVISEPETDLKGTCDLVNKPGDFWGWTMSSITDPASPLGEDIFFNSPNKLWGLDGQNIRGCCTNGVSEYTPNCDSANFRFLNFQTFFNWPDEIYKFFEDGTYAGLTEFISADPDPKASNFCGNGAGVVHEDFDRSFLEGTWSVTADLNLSMLGTSTPQAGSMAAFPNGIIRFLSCRHLIIEQPDNEGGNRNLMKFYLRHNSSLPDWFPLT